MSSVIEVTINNHVAHLLLNRPDAHNAIDGAIMNGLLDFARQMMDPRRNPRCRHFRQGQKFLRRH